MAVAALAHVLIDLGLQRQYLDPGACDPCRNASQVRDSARHLFAFAGYVKLPCISVIDTAREIRPERYVEIPGAMCNPELQRPEYANLRDHRVMHLDNYPCMPLDIFSRHQQVIFTKSHRDPFTNPKLDRLLTELPVKRFTIFGVAVESSLRILALGLLQRNRSVEVIQDACGCWDCESATMTMRQLDVKGCRMTTAADFLKDQVRRSATRTRRRTRVA